MGNATTGQNGSDQAPVGLTRLPNTILDTFIPGYSLLSGFILEVFSFDISILVSIAALLFGVTTVGTYIYHYLRGLFYTHLVSSVTVEYRDDLYEHVLTWVSGHDVTKKNRSIRAQSVWASAWDADDYVDLGLMSNGLVNFKDWESKVPPRFEPHDGSPWFWYKGYYFQLLRERERVGRNWGSYTVTRNEERLTIRVFGRSTEPIKKLIVEARDMALAKDSSKTAIRRPGPKESGSAFLSWKKVATRPSRPIETVALDDGQKNNVLMDINEYLHPTSRRWYANRGIPYRRGYLFHGPPGTGKTSLSFAIAGVFGLNIYCISLLEPTLTEGDLANLFNSLPPRCVVLLEDIDTAGLARRSDQIASNDEGSADSIDGTEKQPSSKAGVSRKTKVTAGLPGDKDSELSPGISLSGLLNAIDGVASHEGRVLVMTTNHPERLDEALIRPGRVDMRIGFTLATKQQIREIFLRMYSNEETVMPSKPTEIDASGQASKFYFSNEASKSATPAKNGVCCSTEKLEDNCTTPSSTATDVCIATPRTDDSVSNCTVSCQRSHISADYEDGSIDIEDLATIFAARVPELIFSPADVQGFLLVKKQDPMGAVEGVQKWRDETLAAKKIKSDSAVKANIEDEGAGAKELRE